jgi:hypothetical protein
MPARVVYLTSGRSRTMSLGKQVIELQHALRWQLALANRPAREAIRAPAWLGPDKTEAALQTLKRKMPQDAFGELVAAVPQLPTWARPEGGKGGPWHGSARTRREREWVCDKIPNFSAVRMITDYHAKLYVYALRRRHSVSQKLAGALLDAQVDLNPHQVEAALFALKSPLAKGTILADEVGFGKTIEAGLVLAQKWTEGRRRILIICPANLRKQWSREMTEKFFPRNT